MLGKLQYTVEKAVSDVCVESHSVGIPIYLTSIIGRHLVGSINNATMNTCVSISLLTNPRVPVLQIPR